MCVYFSTEDQGFFKLGKYVEISVSGNFSEVSEKEAQTTPPQRYKDVRTAGASIRRFAGFFPDAVPVP